VNRRTELIDLMHDGHAGVIASCMLETDEGIAIVDPGPTSTIERLSEGLEAFGASLAEVRWLLLTHIHLDHAGASGSLTERFGELEVIVHQNGARHLLDPSRLMKSAKMVFGPDTDRLWGECLPVDEPRLRVVNEDEVLSLGGRDITVTYTPGHAKHHVTYFDSHSGTAFVGDTAGSRVQGTPTVLPATPPPDIDITLLEDSARRINQFDPDHLFVTHFGWVNDVESHLGGHIERVREWTKRVEADLARGGTDEMLSAEFARDVGAEIRNNLSESDAKALERGAPPKMSWYGLARYCRKLQQDA